MKKITVGIDSGSRTTKIVFWDGQQNRILFSDINVTGINPSETANILYQKGLTFLNLKSSEIERIFSTGYGRNIVKFSEKKISEISCHARGIFSQFPNARTIIDIGGQDSKVISISEKGKVLDFAMNDKCAAGTGRFLEVAANILETTVDELGKLSEQASEDIEINSTCVVFAESEIIGLISTGISIPNIINAVHISIAKRIRNLISAINVVPILVFTGGVAKNSGMLTAIEKLMKIKIETPQDSSLTGAIGAAIFAYEL